MMLWGLLLMLSFYALTAETRAQVFMLLARRTRKGLVFLFYITSSARLRIQNSIRFPQRFFYVR